MVILQSVLKEQTLTTESAIVRKTTQQIGKVVKEIQDISMSLRMVPIKPTFQKMQRIVRDTAVAVQKDVGIKLVGEDTELDKTVLEKINDPLVHLIRNSVDHGIEPADVRVAEGKPAKGLVTLSAAQKSGKLVIEVTDDGGGLNPEKLKKKAIEKGILKPGVELSEKEAFNLIFAPGFSTKEQVSDVSGRGVGMDVVKTNIHELSGEIQIFSQLKKGTTFQITLPLSLAIIDGMVISFANDKFVVPLNQVYETLRPKADQVQFNQSLGYTLMLRGENLPLYRLGDFFNYQSKQATTDMIALVIRSNTKPYAILVDDILGQYQVVVKKLSAELQNMKGISGSTILA
jgi:two-component system chemotaxis sensor kinase CheA